MGNISIIAHAADDLRGRGARASRSQRPTQANVPIAYGEVCGSDLHYWRPIAAGASVLPPSRCVLGHES